MAAAVTVAVSVLVLVVVLVVVAGDVEGDTVVVGVCSGSLVVLVDSAAGRDNDDEESEEEDAEEDEDVDKEEDEDGGPTSLLSAPAATPSIVEAHPTPVAPESARVRGNRGTGLLPSSAFRCWASATMTARSGWEMAGSFQTRRVLVCKERERESEREGMKRSGGGDTREMRPLRRA